MVSEAGRRRTSRFLASRFRRSRWSSEFVHDVRNRGLAAVLDYGRRLDGADLTAETFRVPRRRAWRAHAAAAPQLLATIRRIRENIRTFQQAILEHDVRLPNRTAAICGSAICRSAGRHLRARRSGGLSVDRADDGRAGPGGRRARVGRGGAADEVRGLQRRSAGHVPRIGHHRSLSRRRCAGRGGAGLRRRRACRGWTRSSARAICSWPWRRSMFTARSTSTRSPGPAKW